MKTVIEMAREADLIDDTYASDWYVYQLERFADLVRADERNRADALAETIAGLRDIVTSEAESKDDFIARVRNVLGACPDQRVLHAVEAEREACAKVCEALPIFGVNESRQWERATLKDCAAAIRARSNT